MTINTTAKPDGCEEAALGVSFFYLPCNKPAENIVGWKGRSDKPIRMCAACTDHNVKNRGGQIIRPFQTGESTLSDDKTTENLRERIGGNNPPLGALIGESEGDFAGITTGYLATAYAKHIAAGEELLEEARKLPREIPDDDVKGKFTSLIKRIRDHAKALTAFHSKEKQPYLRGGQAVDQFFFGTIDKLSRRDRKANPGAADVLNNRLTEYDNKVLEAERLRRQREAEEAARIAREAQEKADREAAEEAARVRAAEEAKLAAERARNPDRKEEKAAVADAAQAAAAEQAPKTDAAAVDASAALAKAQEAHLATTARPADIMRTRGQDGTLSTMAQEKYAEITDYAELDKAMAALWPHIPAQAKQQAVNAYARATDYRQSLPGCDIGRRNKSQVR